VELTMRVPTPAQVQRALKARRHELQRPHDRPLCGTRVTPSQQCPGLRYRPCADPEPWSFALAGAIQRSGLLH
jgi:hypothetical protein